MPAALPDLMRRIDDALDAKGGLDVSASELALMRDLGAIDQLQIACDDDARADNLPRIDEAYGDERDTFIYFMRQGIDGPIKIGFARDPAKRRTDLQLATHQQLTVMAAIRRPQRVERQLHQHFTAERIRGEWYRPSPRLLRFIGECQQ